MLMSNFQLTKHMMECFSHHFHCLVIISFVSAAIINLMVCTSTAGLRNPHPGLDGLVRVMIAPGLWSSYCGARPSCSLLCQSVI